MKLFDKIKAAVTDKDKVANAVDLASNLVPYKMAVDGVVRLATGHSIKEHLVGDDNKTLEELQAKKTTNPRDVIDIIRDSRNGFFQSSLRYDFMLLESECLLSVYSAEQDEDDLIDARNTVIQAMNSDTNRIKSRAKELLKTIDTKYDLKKVILNCSGARRQFVMIVPDIEGCYDKTKKITWILKENEVPKEFKFSNGNNYQFGRLYVQHPYLDYKYELIDDVPDVFVEERSQELIRLLAALGAVEIQITSEIESSLLDKFMNNISASVKVENPAKSGEVDSKSQYKRDSYKNSQNHKGYLIKCDPHTPPFCPEDRVWYLHDWKFNDFVQARLNSNVLEYREEITSSNSSNITSDFVTDLNATMKGLKNTVNVGIHYDQSKMTESKFNIKWNVYARFKPMTDFGSQVH